MQDEATPEPFLGDITSTPTPVLLALDQGAEGPTCSIAGQRRGDRDRLLRMFR